MSEILSTPFVTGFVLALVGVLLLVPPLCKLALRVGFVDAPGGRKRHEALVPPIGGLIIFPVFMAVSVFMDVPLSQYWALFAGLIILLVTGGLDDKLQLPAWGKFAVQVFVSFLVVIFGDLQLHHLGNLFGWGDLGLGPFSLLFSVAAVALLINAINLMDGLDGLAGGKSMVVFIWLAIACAIGQRFDVLYVLAPIMGALLGFLFYNMRHPLRARASVFLGDAGSLGLGLMLAWFCMSLAKGDDAVLEPISVAWIVALPVMDACGQFYRRVREGKHPFSPDRGHFHHHLIHAGIPVGQSTAMILILGFVLGGIGYLGALLGVPLVVLTVVWIVLLLSHMALSQKPDHYVTFFSRLTAEGDRDA